MSSVPSTGTGQGARGVPLVAPWVSRTKQPGCAPPSLCAACLPSGHSTLSSALRSWKGDLFPPPHRRSRRDRSSEARRRAAPATPPSPGQPVVCVCVGRGHIPSPPPLLRAAPGEKGALTCITFSKENLCVYFETTHLRRFRIRGEVTPWPPGDRAALSRARLGPQALSPGAPGGSPALTVDQAP